MTWRDVARASLLLLLIAVGVPTAVAQETADPTEAQDEPAPVEEEAPESTTEDSGEEAVPGESDAALEASDPEAPEGSSSSEDADAEAPANSEDADDQETVQLTVTADAKCTLYVDGELEGRVEPVEPLEVEVDTGEVKLRAASTAVAGAVWEETLELVEGGEQSVRIKMKRTIRQFRKEERKTGVYRDTETELMWPKRDNGRDVDLRRAYAYCRDLETGGFDDWRLPLLDELRSLEAIWARTGFKIQGGITLSECCPWSSDYDGEMRAWTFNYRFRQAFEANAGYALGFRALCVRAWDPEKEPAESEKQPEEAGDEPAASEDADLVEGDRGGE